MVGLSLSQELSITSLPCPGSQAIPTHFLSLAKTFLEGQRPLTLDEHEVVKAMQEDEYFKPVVRAIDKQFFGLPHVTLRGFSLRLCVEKSNF